MYTRIECKPLPPFYFYKRNTGNVRDNVSLLFPLLLLSIFTTLNTQRHVYCTQLNYNRSGNNLSIWIWKLNRKQWIKVIISYLPSSMHNLEPSLWQKENLQIYRIQRIPSNITSTRNVLTIVSAIDKKKTPLRVHTHRTTLFVLT